MTRTHTTNNLIVKRQAAVNYIKSSPTMSLQVPPRTSAIDALFAAVPDLQHSRWPDEKLRLLTEDLAQLAFRLSSPLKQEFGQLSTFLAYWDNLVKQRRHGIK